ncbi:MAG: HAMP domain-containing sensor histidine kinase [Thermoleophilia bacterium]
MFRRRLVGIGVLAAGLFITMGLLGVVFHHGGRPGAGILVLAVLVLVWLGRSVRRLAAPIGDVMEAADRVADGEYDARVAVRGPAEVRRLGVAFNRMTQRLQDADDQRRRLLADVTHELRTPLTVIRGNLEGMHDGVYPADREHLAAVLEESRVLGRLIDDLQVLSTAEAGVLRLHREPTDVAALAGEVLAAHGPRAAAAGVRLIPPAGTPPPVDVDPLRVRQVLENLVANASRHAPAGGWVRVDVRAMAGGGVEVTVADDGPGIDPAIAGRVFQRYQRSADSGGMGLGLAIARGLVESHGGTIRAEAPPEGGTAIVFTLPAAHD